MIDDRDLLERALGRFEPQPGLTERVYRRRDRKRRNQRIAAGIVGIAVFAASIWIMTSGGLFDRTQTPAVPGPAETGPAETGPPPARASAQSAGADDGFRGRYRVIALDDTCVFLNSARYRVRIRYVSETVRTYDRFAPGSGRPLIYVRGERFPWQRQGGSLVELRYDPRTNTAIGIQQGPQCRPWRVRLVPLG